MKKLEKLTSKQIARLSEFQDKWLSIGLSTGGRDRQLSEQYIDDVYKVANLRPPKIKIWLDSPLAGSVAAFICSKNWSQVEAQVGAQVWDQVRDQVYKCGYGAHDASWLSFYEYFLKVCGLRCCEKLMPIMLLSQHCAWWWPFTDLVILTELPTEIHLQNKILHKDGGPAIAYRDGFSVYALNGVRVTKKIAETPVDGLDPHMILKEKNAEIRREIVRKVGIDKVVNTLATHTLDSKDDYTLLGIDIGDNRIRPYLKMRNPSIDAWHIEGIHPDCKTVDQALAWRNGLKTYNSPEVLT